MYTHTHTHTTQTTVVINNYIFPKQSWYLSSNLFLYGSQNSQLPVILKKGHNSKTSDGSMENNVYSEVSKRLKCSLLPIASGEAPAWCKCFPGCLQKCLPGLLSRQLSLLHREQKVQREVCSLPSSPFIFFFFGYCSAKRRVNFL